MSWTKEVETHPPWLRFHLGISRWELYDRKDPNLALLTHYLARQRVLGAGEWGGGDNRLEDRRRGGARESQQRMRTDVRAGCSEEGEGFTLPSISFSVPENIS